MQTLVEKICEKVGEDRLYTGLIQEGVQPSARYPGIEINMPINFPGPEIHTGTSLELKLGYQTPQNLYAMYSFGVNDGPVTIGGWFEPLAGATTGLYPEPKGLINPEPFQGGYDMPGTGTQLHLHGPNSNTITHGHIVPYGRQPGEKPLAELNGYEASMASFNADRFGFKKF